MSDARLLGGIHSLQRALGAVCFQFKLRAPGESMGCNGAPKRPLLPLSAGCPSDAVLFHSIPGHAGWVRATGNPVGGFANLPSCEAVSESRSRCADAQFIAFHFGTNLQEDATIGMQATGAGFTAKYSTPFAVVAA